MSLLDDHFEKVRKLERQGQPILKGFFTDVCGTLFLVDEEIPENTEFVRWAAGDPRFSQIVTFTTTMADANNMFRECGVTPQDFGSEELEDKGSMYDMAQDGWFTTESGLIRRGKIPAKLELVFDDRPIRVDEAVTVWNTSKDHRVKDFLKRQIYKHKHFDAA